MSKAFATILFAHKGREAYPEIAAYRSFFAGRYETGEVLPGLLSKQKDLSQTICWFLMGFYPSRPYGAGLVVHDYRSLSVGALSGVKDRIKRYGNARPDIRIFQNEAMRALMGFHDGVPDCLLPMGVPPEILAFREQEKPSPGPDFCYIGAMSEERRTPLMIDSFLRRFGETKTFYLYGSPEPSLVRRYRKRPNVVFAGRLPQTELFPLLRASRVAVNMFPSHRPHSLQTPTKLLEYAALGMRILSNEQPQSRLAALQYGIRAKWGAAEDVFRDAPEALDWETNEGLDPSSFLWPGVIARSGIAALLEKGAA